jgi:hypothetical protein
MQTPSSTIRDGEPVGGKRVEMLIFAVHAEAPGNVVSAWVRRSQGSS